MTQILALAVSGYPFGWISTQEAILYYATGKVAWEVGEREFVFRGGFSNAGIQSTITVKPIIAVSGSERMTRMLRAELPLGDDNNLLFARDRNTCAYCGVVAPRKYLSRDHIVPRSRGGLNVWSNCVCCCLDCNNAKGSKLVHEFRPLLYVPYVPCRFEHFILSGRNVLSDQHDYLAARLPDHSRLLN